MKVLHAIVCAAVAVSASLAPSLFESKCVDQCGQRGGLLSSARVVQEEARERLTPLLKDAHERATIDVRRRAILTEVRQAHSIERCPNDQFHIVHDQWPIDGDRQRALALVDLLHKRTGPQNKLRKIAETDDLHISPFREGSVNCGSIPFRGSAPG